MIYKPKHTKSSFLKALIVPVAITLLTIIPYFRICFEWLEQKYLDFLFVLYPKICSIIEQPSQNNSPSVVITKDQAFQLKFGRAPNRKDFAKLLDNLSKQGVQVAAIDYIFDEPTTDENDNALATSLEKFPYPILAHNFIGREQNTFNTTNSNNNNSERPAWPLQLCKSIANKAVTKGLVNMTSSQDSVVRYAPLAFHPSGSERFLPTLGFSTWILSLLSESESQIDKIDISKATNLTDALDRIYGSAPYQFHTVGHKGLDKTIAELENSFLLRYISQNKPQIPLETGRKLLEIIRAYSNVKDKTWVKLPEKPLSIIGSYDTPSIRILYKKRPELYKGDGIETISMARLLEREDRNSSAFQFAKNHVNISPDIKKQNLKIAGANNKKGDNSLSGSIRTVTGEPVSNAKILAIMPNNGFWQKTYTNEKGDYTLENLPLGEFVINAYIKEDYGWEKATINLEVKEKQQKLPLLLLSQNTSSIEIPLRACKSNTDSTLWIFGKVVPMLFSNEKGSCGTKSIPEDFLLCSLNNTEKAQADFFSLDTEGRLLQNGNIATNTIVTVKAKENNWNLHFYRKISLNSDQKLVIGNIPTAINTTISLTNEFAGNLIPSKRDIALTPGETTKLDSLPKAFLSRTDLVNVSVSFGNTFAENNKALLLSNSGEEYEISENTPQYVLSGNYLVLTEASGLKGLYKPALIEEKVAFLGTSLAEDQDFAVLPINFLDNNFSRVPGVNVHANLFTVLKNQTMFYAPPFHMDSSPKNWPLLQFLLVFPIFIILSIKVTKSESIKTGFLGIFIIFGLAALSLILFFANIIIPVIYPGVLILSFTATRIAIEWINTRRLAHETQTAFSRFISADVVSQIISNSGVIKPGGEKKELSIIFTDIAGFTSISEKLEPEELTALMNNYLNEMTKILFKYGGTLDKYIGDAIMGFWNHPTPQEDHATRAVNCAIEMQKKLHELRDEWVTKGLPKVECRAGINSGYCMVGFIGSDSQMNFTCLGDNVNLASRLEGANKTYGTSIMVSESVKKQLNPYLFSTRFLDFLAVKGKDQPVSVYEVRGWIKDEKEIWKSTASNLYQEGINNYLERKWNDAIANFMQVIEIMGEDAPSQVYIERCKNFKTNPPPEKWDGRYILHTK